MPPLCHIGRMYSIRPATADDLATIVHMNAAMAVETEGVVLDRERLTAGVTAALANPDRAFYLVAQSDDGCAVGQLMITTEWSDWRNGVFWWIQSVFVAPAMRRKGVYRSLYRVVLDMAAERSDVCGVRLYVHHDNQPAQAAYTALGMARSEYHLFEVDFVVKRSPPRDFSGENPPR